MPMFCPKCGIEEINDTQYCRACGGDLNTVRVAIANPSTDSAKTEIGRAFAKQIEGLTTAKELKKATEKILPEVEKFLASPKERRLSRIRNGSIISFVGLGVALGFTLAGIFGDGELFKLAALGLVTLCIGIAFLVNGFYFSVPENNPTALNESDRLTGLGTGLPKHTNDLLMPASARHEFSSVTENTTRTLDNKLPQSKSADDD